MPGGRAEAAARRYPPFPPHARQTLSFLACPRITCRQETGAPGIPHSELVNRVRHARLYAGEARRQRDADPTSVIHARHRRLPRRSRHPRTYPRWARTN